jgi:hypothetical protein
MSEGRLSLVDARCETGVTVWGLRSGYRGMIVIMVRAGAETERECEKHVDF